MIGAAVACMLSPWEKGSMVVVREPTGRVKLHSPWAYGPAFRLVNACVAIALFCATLLPMPAEAAKLLALGDSLTAGLGLPTEQGFTARLHAALAADGRE